MITTYERVVARDRPLQWWRVGNVGTALTTLNSGIQQGAGTLTCTGLNLSTGPGLPSAPGGVATIPAGATGTDGYEGWIAGSHSLGIDATGAISLETWVNPVATNIVFAQILGRRYGSNRETLGLWVNNAAIQLRLANVTANTLTHGITAATNTWFHLVGIVRMEANATHELWVNGRPVTFAVSVAQTVADTGFTCIGRSGLRLPGSTSTNRNAFSGSISEPCIYNYALTPSQIGEHYRVGLGAVRRQAVHTAFGYPFMAQTPPPSGLTAIGDVTNRRIALVSDRPR